MIDDGTSYAAWLEGVQLLHATTAQKLRRPFDRAALILFSELSLICCALRSY